MISMKMEPVRVYFEFKFQGCTYGFADMETAKECQKEIQEQYGKKPRIYKVDKLAGA